MTCTAHIHYTKKVKDIKYPELFCVVHKCYACHSAYTHYTKKLRIFNIVNFLCVVYIFLNKVQRDSLRLENKAHMYSTCIYFYYFIL